jgi:hypothetical protein
MAPAISTPVGPPPTTIDVVRLRCSAGSLLSSASSNPRSTLARICRASATVLSPGANAFQPSLPK